MIPFGSVVMAHVPLDQQTTDGPGLSYITLWELLWGDRGMGGFECSTLCRTYKILIPTPQSQTRTEYEIVENGGVTEIAMSHDMNLVSDDVDDYKYFIDCLHRDIEYELELFTIVVVVVETFDEME